MALEIWNDKVDDRPCHNQMMLQISCRRYKGKPCAAGGAFRTRVTSRLRICWMCVRLTTARILMVFMAMSAERLMVMLALRHLTIHHADRRNCLHR